MWNIPNILTVARLSLLPAIVVLLWPGIEDRYACFWAAILFSVGSILDLVDGYIARKLDMITVFGKFLDPLADKLFYLVTLIALMQLPGPRIPPWVVMVIVARELTITGLRGMAASEGIVIAAGEGGKLKTTLASVGAACLVLHFPYLIDLGFTTLQVDFHRVGIWITLFSVFISVYSGIAYVIGFVRATRQGTSTATE